MDISRLELLIGDGTAENALPSPEKSSKKALCEAARIGMGRIHDLSESKSEDGSQRRAMKNGSIHKMNVIGTFLRTVYSFFRFFQIFDRKR